MAKISKIDQTRHTRMPVYGAAADIERGAFLMAGATAATDGGMLIKASGSSATPDIMGILDELHDYSVTGDTNIGGTVFVTHSVSLIAPDRIIRLEYDQTAGSAIVCTEAVNSTTMTVTSIEDNLDGGFVYTVSGTGLGQTNYITADNGAALTLKAAFGTDLDTTTYFIKILPRFHDLISLSTDGTMLASQAAAGAVTGMIFDSHIVYRGVGNEAQLDPTKHAALTGLNNQKGVKFEADIAIRNSAVYTTE